MSNLRSLKKPKKHKKNIGYVILAVLLVIGIAMGIALLSGKGLYRTQRADIKTEIVQEENS